MTSPTRLVLVPRWAGTPDSDFYPWLARLVSAGAVPGVTTIDRLSLPDADAPRIEPCVSQIIAALSASAVRTVLLAHSVGCQAALRALATSSCPPVSATLLVAPWRTVDKPWPTLQPWTDTPFQLANARQRAGRVRGLVSDNDPFTSDWASTKGWLESELGADVSLHHGARHFNETEEPAVLDALVAAIASS